LGGSDDEADREHSNSQRNSTLYKNRDGSGALPMDFKVFDTVQMLGANNLPGSAYRAK